MRSPVRPEGVTVLADMQGNSQQRGAAGPGGGQVQRQGRGRSEGWGWGKVGEQGTKVRGRGRGRAVVRAEPIPLQEKAYEGTGGLVNHLFLMKGIDTGCWLRWM